MTIIGITLDDCLILRPIKILAISSHRHTDMETGRLKKIAQVVFQNDMTDHYKQSNRTPENFCLP